MFKYGRYDYSNQNAIPFCYSSFWTARLKKKKKSYTILNCAVHINVRKSLDRSLYWQFILKVTWYLSCFILSTEKIPVASSLEGSLLSDGLLPLNSPLPHWYCGLNYSAALFTRMLVYVIHWPVILGISYHRWPVKQHRNFCLKTWIWSHGHEYSLCCSREWTLPRHLYVLYK